MTVPSNGRFPRSIVGNQHHEPRRQRSIDLEDESESVLPEPAWHLARIMNLSISVLRAPCIAERFIIPTKWDRRSHPKISRWIRYNSTRRSLSSYRHNASGAFWLGHTIDAHLERFTFAGEVPNQQMLLPRTSTISNLFGKMHEASIITCLFYSSIWWEPRGRFSPDNKIFSVFTRFRTKFPQAVGLYAAITLEHWVEPLPSVVL